MLAPGAKLYVGEVHWGTSDRLHIIGQRRGSRKLVNCVIGFDLVTDLRAKLIYSPTVLAALTKLNGFLAVDRADADDLLVTLKRLMKNGFQHKFGKFSELE